MAYMRLAWINSKSSENVHYILQQHAPQMQYIGPEDSLYHYGYRRQYLTLRLVPVLCLASLSLEVG